MSQAVDLRQPHRRPLVQVPVDVVLHDRKAELLRERENAMAVCGVGARTGRIVQQGLHEEGARPMRAAGGFEHRKIRPGAVARHRDEPHVVGAQLLEQYEVARILHQHRIAG